MSADSGIADGRHPPDLGRAIGLMTVSSALVPVAGVLTQPILANSLGVDGRGELAAALAPSYLALAAATLGIPDALTYFLARRPDLTRRALAFGSSVTLLLGGVSVAVVWALLPTLSGGDPELGGYILLAIGLTLPALVVGVLRGAASGCQLWNRVALERLVNTGARLVAIAWLALSGELTVLTAVLVSTLTPVIAGLVYGPLFSARSVVSDEPGIPKLRRSIARYGSRVWLGSVASMLLSRTDQLLMVPLSDVTQLGLYSVAVTVADVPLVVVLAVGGALRGVNSRTGDAGQVVRTARSTLALAALGCAVIALVVPFGVPVLFGREFEGAVGPTLLLLVSAVLCVPGIMAAAGASARGRPGLRSVGLAIALVVNVATFALLVPHLGAIGAAIAGVVANLVLTSYMLRVSSRLLGVGIGDFVLVRRADVAGLIADGRRLWRRRGRAATRG